MSCAVYCLVPDPEQIDPLVGRLQDAGVQSRDIMVVRRQGPAALGDGGARASSLYFVPAFWNLPLGPAAWWWPLALSDWGAEPAPPAGAAGRPEHEIISLASYRAKRASGAI